MTRIYSAIVVARPIDLVYDYVTTPRSWPRWHPSSLGVSGAVDHSLEVGEEVREEFLTAGRTGFALWTVAECERPNRWVIEGKVEGEGAGTVTYSLTARPEGTLFEREFVYQVRSPLVALMNWLVLRHRIAAESELAVRQLKQVVEGGVLEKGRVFT
jgi:uncharacterized protein YndB with AHSA1/START domain